MRVDSASNEITSVLNVTHFNYFHFVFINRVLLNVRLLQDQTYWEESILPRSSLADLHVRILANQCYAEKKLCLDGALVLHDI